MRGNKAEEGPEVGQANRGERLETCAHVPDNVGLVPRAVLFEGEGDAETDDAGEEVEAYLGVEGFVGALEFSDVPEDGAVLYGQGDARDEQYQG